MKRKVLMMILAVSLALAGCSGGKDDAQPVRGTSSEPVEESAETSKPKAAKKPVEEEKPDEEEPVEEEGMNEEEAMNEPEDQPVISNYSVTRDDFSQHLENGNGSSMYFDKVTFEGADENLIAWLNGQIESLEGTYQKEANDNAEGYLEYLQGCSSGTFFEYSPHELSHIFYDDNYVSVGWTCPWFAGGVSNTEYEYVNYDLNSKAQLTVTDVLGINAHNSIAQALNKVDESGFLSEQLKSIVIDDIPFYFDTDTVYLNFPSYMLDQGGAGIEVTLPRLIK